MIWKEENRKLIDPISRYLLRGVGSQTCIQGRGPILLMYHGTPCGEQHPSSRYSLSASRFAEQLSLLQELGWHTACVRDFLQAETLAEKTAVLTFDDGYANNYDGAFFPLLERGMRATWLVVSGTLGGYSHWTKPHTAPSLMMTKEQLRELAESGMEIGSHTRTHPDLTTLSESELEKEISGSRKELEDHLGQEVLSFAYPYGRISTEAVNAVRQAGYFFACSARPGWYGSEKDPLRLRRVTIFSHDSLGSFARKLAFADNNMGWQRVARYLFGRVIARLQGPVRMISGR